MTGLTKEPAVGDAGLTGWAIGPDDHDVYSRQYQEARSWLARLWYWFRPIVTKKKIAYVRADGGLSIVTPSQSFFFLLRRGGIVRHMRQIDAFGPMGIPVFEGTGEIMGPMSEDEAIAFLIWKDIPRGTNRIVVLDEAEIPSDRSRRNSWQLSEDGRIIA